MNPLENNRKRHVVIAGPFPPPVNGFSYITQQVAGILSAHYDTEIIDLSPHAPRAGWQYHFHRIVLTAKGLRPLLRGRRFAARAFYIACEGNLGIVYTIVLSLAARLLGYPLFIHHHSFGYIETYSMLMKTLLVASGRQTTHIFLCAAMAERFAARYRVSVNATILSNSAFVAPAAAPAGNDASARPITIGLLSNLSLEKGLGIFLDVLRAALAGNMPVKAVLAGPPHSAAEHHAIEAACREFAGRLDYRGAVYGAEKEDFFKRIDVFVFPTHYANEAQPTVLFEALSHGIPVLSFDRGCICSQTKNFGATLRRDGEFVPFALEWLKSQLSSPASFARLRLAAHEDFTKDHREARRLAAGLFDARTVRIGAPMKENSMGPKDTIARVDIWHNILWSIYKGEVFSSVYAACDKGEFDLKFFQIAETEGNRISLSGVDLNRHRYPYRLIFKGSYDAIPLLRRITALFRHTYQSNADIVVLAGFHKPEYWVQFFVLKLKRKKIAVFCDSTMYDNKQNALRSLLKRFFFKSVDGVFCYGARSREYVISYGANPSHVFKRCQAAALPMGYTQENAFARRMQLAPAADRPRYVYVGRLSPEKDLDTLLDAFHGLLSHCPQATLTLVGSGPERSRLEEKSRALGLENQVTFGGSKSGDELAQEYLKSTCLVLPSLSEPWGLVVNEALSYGCPVVVSGNCGCVPELVIENKTGFSHRVGDADDLMQKMLQAQRRFSDTAATAKDCLELISTFSSEAAAIQILEGLRIILKGGVSHG